MSGYIGTQPVPQATQTRDSFTATSGQTSFATGGYTPNFLDVYLNGVKLSAADYTASNGSDVVLASGASTGDILEVVAFTTFNSASSSIDDNGNATALTIDSSENVLVGKASADSNSVGIELHSNDIIKVTRSGGATGYFNRQTNNGNILELAKDGTTVGTIGTPFSNAMYITGPTSTGSGFVLQSDDKIYPAKAGARVDNYVDLGGSVFRYKDAYLSGGVYLGGTGSANKLEDYEEGSWTPLAKGTSTNPSSAPTLIGRYTKIGNQVNLYLKFDAVSFAGASGGVYFDGLPFSASGTTVHGVGSIMQYNVCTFNDSPCLYVSGSAVYIYHNVSGGTWDNSQHTGSSAVYMNACVTYTTNS